MLENLRADFARVRDDRKRTMKGRPRFLQNLRVLLALTTWSVISYRFSHWVYKMRVPIVRPILSLVALVFQRWVELWTACHICIDAEIGPGLLIHSPYAIAVGPTRIGKNCTIGTGVLITGGAKGVGDNVWFGPGAKVIGDTRIGSNVVIVANSLVVSDVSDNSTVMGVPARISIRGGTPQRFPTEIPA